VHEGRTKEARARDIMLSAFPILPSSVPSADQSYSHRRLRVLASWREPSSHFLHSLRGVPSCSIPVLFVPPVAVSSLALRFQLSAWPYPCASLCSSWLNSSYFIFFQPSASPLFFVPPCPLWLKTVFWQVLFRSPHPAFICVHLRISPPRGGALAW